jgi:AraC family transcriptional regulator of adaptative response/methylated-DNA-[protein]-cysteine methyltransferase
VASAIGQNPVSFLIPCHRVLRKSGHISGYRWGSIRKKAIIAWEAGQTGQDI